MKVLHYLKWLKSSSFWESEYFRLLHRVRFLLCAATIVETDCLRGPKHRIVTLRVWLHQVWFERGTALMVFKWFMQIELSHEACIYIQFAYLKCARRKRLMQNGYFLSGGSSGSSAQVCFVRWILLKLNAICIWFACLVIILFAHNSPDYRYRIETSDWQTVPYTWGNP